MTFVLIDVDLPSDDCPRDFLLIYSGAVADREAEKRLCGHWENWEWIIRGHEVVVQLISDGSDTYQGFHLNFQSLEKMLPQSRFSIKNIYINISFKRYKWCFNHWLYFATIMGEVNVNFRDGFTCEIFQYAECVLLGVSETRPEDFYLFLIPYFMVSSQGTLQCSYISDVLEDSCRRNRWWIRVDADQVPDILYIIYYISLSAYQWLSARRQFVQYVSNGDNEVLY